MTKTRSTNYEKMEEIKTINSRIEGVRRQEEKEAEKQRQQ